MTAKANEPKRGTMNTYLKTASLSALIISMGLSHLSAQRDEREVVVDLISRVGALEEENRELRGQLDESRHEVAELSKRMETLSADIDYRLNNPESGTPPLPHDAGPLPLTKQVESPPAPAKKPTSTLGEYEAARAHLEQGDYEAAEKAFAGFVSAHPKDEHAGAAQYWLGVTFFVRGQHEKAAKAFAKGYKSYPKSPKAPDNLLKLAKSLSSLDRNADACATLEQISSEYPKVHIEEVSAEKKKLRCK